jgi:UDP-N-acetylmuramate dehydrogenase
MIAVKEEMRIRGAVRFAEPMAKHTSWRVGGTADRFFEPADLDDLAAFLAQCGADEPLLWIGLGSNLLVRDGGVRGTVISTSKTLNDYRFDPDGTAWAQVGVPCVRLARESARRGFTGTEFLAGIPGTLGGALAMNAGAFGGEIWDLVTHVESIDRTGTLRRRAATDYTVGYREVRGPAGEWFVGSQLAMERDPTAAGEQRIRTLLARRQESQPIGQPSCGSVFRNPPGDFAARLIDVSGLKGLRIGKSIVSEKHANFIINEGGASAADIEALIETVRRRVKGEQGIDLVPEVRIVGDRRASE